MEEFAENCKFGKSRQILDKINVQQCEKSCLVLKLCHCKVQRLDVPMKIVRSSVYHSKLL